VTAQQEYERFLRRNAFSLAFLLLYLPGEEAQAAITEARAILAGAVICEPTGVDLHSRLPPKRADAFRTLRMLRLWLSYINSGEVDMIESASVGTHFIMPDQDLDPIPGPYYGRPQVVSSR